MLQTKWIFIFIFMYIEINAVPPEACFAKFRWDDCGRPPKRVLYYWKPGSRCEVGIWRGCLPNFNMFHDEYECVSTCIFTARAQPDDYHKVTEVEEVEESITEYINVTSSINDDNVTTTEEVDTDDGNTTDVVETRGTTTVADIGNTTDAVVTSEITTVEDVGNTTDVVETTTVETNGIATNGNETVSVDDNESVTNNTNNDKDKN
ncbi:uncharacterized protein [Maniola hyperantus]|uniref:uncharacterized protein n=1 Tax=Aphantopus hyperantus TaxID=2795564 RepID=UPI0037483EBE